MKQPNLEITGEKRAGKNKWFSNGRFEKQEFSKKNQSDFRNVSKYLKFWSKIKQEKYRDETTKSWNIQWKIKRAGKTKWFSNGRFEKLEFRKQINLVFEMYLNFWSKIDLGRYRYGTTKLWNI